jgi:hydrogenase nickel incorporation protein HypB
MCATCGCDEHVHDDESHRHDAHHHHHDPDDPHDHQRQARLVRLERDVLDKNARLAAGNRARLDAAEVVAFNLVSSPGAGKTTLLERTIRELEVPIYVIEGDQATSRDADRIRAAGARAVQVNTGAGCHLDAHMVAHALDELSPPARSLCLIENVGNLVCPALFDLGERAKVVVASVTEGDDKPLKYPHMFRAGALIVLNKIDLLPYVSFDVERFVENARAVRPDARVLAVSATRGDGLRAWYEWLRAGAGDWHSR